MATGATSVKVKGLKELQRDLRKISKDVSKEVREGLKKAAEPVRVEASRLLAPIDARSAAGFKVRVRGRGIAVEQSRRRTTGAHPEFGALQMRRALLPALMSRQDEIIEGLEEVLDDLADRNGF